MIKPLIFISACLFSFSVLAESAPKRAPASDLFEVEVIVFQNIQAELEGNEVWDNERITMEFVDIDKAVEANKTPQENSDLTKAYEMLDSDSNYRVLMHKQWLQYASPQSDSKLVRLSTVDGELDGTLKFFVSRFLHVDLNLVYQVKASTSIFQVGDAEDNSMIAFQLREKRRIRSNEIQYFDHPKFGALVKVKRIMENKN